MMKCLGDNIVVVQGERQTERKGILLPDSVQEDSPNGEVIAIGPEVRDIRVGDTILIPAAVWFRVMQTRKFDLTVEIDGTEKPALVLKEEEIAVIWPKDEVEDA